MKVFLVNENEKVSLIKGGDIFIVVLIISAFGYSIAHLFQNDPTKSAGFEVRHDGVVVATLLSADTSVVVQGDIGPLTLEVKGGSVRVVASTCPHKICNHSAPIQSSGSIVCVPNKVVVEPRVQEVNVDAHVR